MQYLTITNSDEPHQDGSPKRTIEVKESAAGGPRTEVLLPGQSKQFAVSGSSRITITERAIA